MKHDNWFDHYPSLNSYGYYQAFRQGCSGILKMTQVSKFFRASLAHQTLDMSDQKDKIY